MGNRVRIYYKECFCKLKNDYYVLVFLAFDSILLIQYFVVFLFLILTKASIHIKSMLKAPTLTMKVLFVFMIPAGEP